MRLNHFEEYLNNLEDGDFKDEYSKLYQAHNKLSKRTSKVLKVADSFDIQMYKERNSALDESEKALLLSEASDLANDMKSKFLAQMSHEIRTPLNGIIGFIEILKSEENDNQKLDYLNIVDLSSKTLLSVINDILDLSKIETGNLELDLHDFNTLEELKLIVDLFQANAMQKSISIETNFGEKIPSRIHSDSTKLKQIISNLISNAIKFTPSEGKVTFDVTYNEMEKTLHLSITDNGIGMSKKSQEHIFDEYTQAEESTQRTFGGTGLGLNISSKLVDMLGGELSLNSEEGKGSQFSFTIPITLAEIVDERVSQAPVLFNKQRVLVADDNRSNQLLMKILLENMNLECDIASDGEEALSMFKKSEYDLLLFDQHMPFLSGTEVSEEILAYEKENSQKHTPIVAVTGDIMSENLDKIFESGMDDYLAKPVNQKLLYNVILDYIKL